MQYTISKPLLWPVSLHVFLLFQFFYFPSVTTKRQDPQTSKGVRCANGGWWVRTCGKKNKSMSSPTAFRP